MNTTSQTDAPSWPLRLLAAIGPVVLAGSVGSAVTLPNIPGWYAGLAKPPLTPPNGVFGPVWTILYAAMAYAAWRILSRPAGTPGRRAALVAFYVQLGFNALWSVAFFAGHNPAVGLIVIGALLASLVATIGLVRRIDRAAALLLLPYLAWTLFAAYLNGGVWWLNR